MNSPARTYRYKAFLSYSQAADGKLAPALETGLERFAKPWHRLRAFHVFRDKTGLAVTPALWGSIQRAIEASEYFVLLASPASAQSKWVQQEVAFWLQHKSADALLLVLTEGTIAWDSSAGDFDWSRTDALPRLLAGRFGEEPNYLDLRWARQDTDLSVRRPRFLDAVAGLSATMRQVPLDDLIGEDIAHHRTTRRLLGAGVVLLLLFSVSAFYTAYQATRARNLAEGLEAGRAKQLAIEQQAGEERGRQAEAARLAEAERERAARISRELAAKAAEALGRDRELGTLLAIEAAQASQTKEAEDVLRQALARQLPPVVLRGPDQLVVRSATFGPDRRRLLAVHEDGSAWVWTLASPARPVVLPRDSILYAGADDTGASFSPDGSLVLTWPFFELGTFSAPEGDEPAARIWDAATGRLRHELRHRFVQHAAYSPDGRRAVTVGFGSPAVVIWDAETGARLVELDDHEREVVHVEFSRDGRWLVTASKDDTVRIRAAADGMPVASLQVPGESFMKAALLSPDARRVLTLSRSDPARLWDWQGSPGSHVAELLGHEGTVGFAEFSPDSKYLVTLSTDQTARVWDVATGRNVQSLVHDDYVGGAAFSPDSRWIATTSADGLAVLWEAGSGKRLMEFGRHDRPRTSVAFSPDGDSIATGTSRGEVLVHACEICGSTSDLLARARARVTRGLTASERKRYLVGAP